MLGSAMEAEDVVQESYLRWRGASDTDVRSHRAYLVTIVTRLSINQLRSARVRSEEHTSELQSPCNLVCRLLLEKKKKHTQRHTFYTITSSILIGTKHY